jgi:hypothetical protein
MSWRGFLSFNQRHKRSFDKQNVAWSHVFSCKHSSTFVVGVPDLDGQSVCSSLKVTRNVSAVCHTTETSCESSRQTWHHSARAKFELSARGRALRCATEWILCDHCAMKAYIRVPRYM